MTTTKTTTTTMVTTGLSAQEEQQQHTPQRAETPPPSPVGEKTEFEKGEGKGGKAEDTFVRICAVSWPLIHIGLVLFNLPTLVW